MRLVLILAVFQMAGCSTPSQHFVDAPVNKITVDGAQFDVRVRGELAEAIRRNMQYAPRLGVLRAKAGLAMQKVSGCTVEHVLGDAAVTLGLLDCNGQKRDWYRVLQSQGYDCYEIAGLSQNGPAGYTVFECDPH